MNIYTMPNGDKELGDWPARMGQDWINVVWVMTHRCFMGCPYCVGWKMGSDAPKTMVDIHGVDGCIERFEKLRACTKKNMYVTISGGEPLTQKGFPELCKKLTERDFMVELHTNLTTSAFTEWADAVDAKNVSQVMASYHGWRLDKDSAAKNLYIKNFNYAMQKDLTPVLKRVVLPDEVERMPGYVKQIKSILPAGSPTLLWGFISGGAPKNNHEFGKSYPYAYTPKQKAILNGLREYRRNCQKMYHDGGGFFKGMPCDAGRGFVYMSVDGIIHRCYAMRGKGIGNFSDGTINITNAPTACPRVYCGTPFWGAWFGKNPWDYVIGAKKEDSTFCRYGAYSEELPKYPGR